MELWPELKLGWLNGWLLWALLTLVEALLLGIARKGAAARLFDRSRWSRKRRVPFAIGKLVSVICLVLITLTPLRTGAPLFGVGMVLFGLGLALLLSAVIAFKRTPQGEPVTRGIYRFSRHPQLVALTIAFTGICLSIGSWPALAALALSRLLQHPGALAEEEACLAQYGEAYQAYMQRTPRYLGFR